MREHLRMSLFVDGQAAHPLRPAFVEAQRWFAAMTRARNPERKRKLKAVAVQCLKDALRGGRSCTSR